MKPTIACALVFATLAAGKRVSADATAPPQSSAPCAGPESRELDFWIGEWDLSWPAQGGTPAGSGTNRITKAFDGCVIEENFTDEGPAPLVGHSVSVYSASLKKWQQTWVDNQGSYLDFTGGKVGDEFILSMERLGSDGTKSLARMAFENIRPDSLDWRWEKSTDGGKIWNVLWKIHYLRRKAATSTVAPGSPDVVGSTLTPYRNSWKLSYWKSGSDPKQVAVWTDELAKIERDGKPLLQRTQVATYSAKPIKITTVNVFDPATLAPLAMDYSRSDGIFHRRTFAGVTVADRGNESPAETKATLAAPFFDFYGGMYGLLAAALPLSEGYTAILPAIDESDLKAASASIRVIGRQRVEAGEKKTVDAWVVKADTNQGEMRFWLTKEPPYVIKLEWSSPQGLIATYTMTD